MVIQIAVHKSIAERNVEKPAAWVLSRGGWNATGKPISACKRSAYGGPMGTLTTPLYFFFGFCAITVTSYTFVPLPVHRVPEIDKNLLGASVKVSQSVCFSGISRRDRRWKWTKQEIYDLLRSSGCRGSQHWGKYRSPCEFKINVYCFIYALLIVTYEIWDPTAK